jgi:large repetitive protein
MKRRLLYLLTGFTSLAMPFFVGGSTSTQVEPLGQMAIHRSDHKATALSDGRVLITGGRNTASIVIADAEIFDPNTGESSAVAPMATARVDHTATVLKDGRVLITGGSNATGTLNSAELFDPSTGTFSAVSGSMNMARARHTATLLSSGKVLIAGGDVTPTLVDPNGTDVTGTAEMFDPSEGIFGDLVLLQRSRSGHTATLFSNDTVWLAGGGNNTIESFDATAGAFTLSDTTMTAVRSGHEAFGLSSTSLLFFGGDSGNTIDAFNPSADTLTLKATMDGAASSATLLANGKILVLRPDAAGLFSPDATDQTTAFTAFDEISVPNSTALKRAGQTATELSGDKKILVAGGENAQQQPILQIATFNPARIWTDKDDYFPGDNVILSGSGWKPNENVYLYAVDDTTEAWTYGSTETADANGAFVVNPYFVVQLVQLGANFHVSAVGAQSQMQADVKFTDAAKPASAIMFPADGGSYNSTGWTNGASSKITGTATASSSGGTLTVGVSIKRNSTNRYWNGTSFSSTTEVFTSATGSTSWSYSFQATNFPGDDTYIVRSRAHDDGGDENNPANATFTYDNVAPTAPSTPTLHSGDDSGANGDGITNVPTPHFDGTATANSTVKIYDGASVVGSGSAGNNGSYSVQTTLSEGTHSNITATVTDAAGNESAHSGSTSVTIDTTRPSVTINQAGSDPMSTSPINFTAVFSEPVTGFTSAGVTITGTAGGTKTVVITGGPITYNVAVSGMTTSGTVIANIPQNAARDVAANGNTVATFTDNTVTFNACTAPSSIVVSPSGTISKTVGDSITFSVTASGTAPLHYQWHKDGVNVGTDSSSYSILSVTAADAGSYDVAVSNSCGNATSAATTLTVKITPTLSVINSPVPYNGSPQAATVTASVPGTVSNIKYTGSPTTPTNANTYAVTADFIPTDTTTYSSLTGASAGNFVIKKATPTLSVTNSPVYNGSPQAAVLQANGVSGAITGSFTNIKYNDSSTTPTNAAMYGVTADFTPTDTTNYTSLTGASAGNFVIQKADATVVVTPYTCPSTTYTGLAHTATYTISGVNGETGATVGTINVSGTSHIPAGTYNNDPWSFTGGANYNDQSGTVNDCIAKADAIFTVTPYNVVYDSNPHMAAVGTITGVNGETGATVGTINLSGTTHTNPGTYANDYWSFTGTANYNNIGNTTITDTITFGNCPGSGVILQPINADGSSVFPKSGRTIPVKFTVCDASGNPIFDPYVVFGPSYPSGSLTMLSAVRGLITNVNETSDSVDVPNSAFRYSNGQWIFNMATSNLNSNTTYSYKINLSYGSVTFKIGIK